MEQFQSFNTSFNYFKDLSYKKNEYFVKNKYCKKDDNGNYIQIPMICTNTFIFEDLVIVQNTLSKDRVCLILKHEGIQRFHPNKINNKKFWIKSKEYFPKLSVCGRPSKNIKEVNQNTNQIPDAIGITDIINKIIDDNPEKLNILEIGFGYGNFFFKMKDKCNYTGIDYTIPKFLKKYKNFIEIDKSGIPDYLYEDLSGNELYDIVYSINVLQHCSQKDRFEYFSQAYKALKTGGYFIFSSNVMTEKNKNSECWGYKDISGRGYTCFLTS
jgi:SAM-dependent methyltransferase